MNIDPDRVKELILIFSELDEEYQKELLKQAYVLGLRQNQKDLIAKEKISFKNDFDYKQEIENRSRKSAKKLLVMSQKLKEMNKDQLVEVLILVDKLSSNKGISQDTDIEIKINKTNISLKDYIEIELPGVDFNEANKKVAKYVKENLIETK